MSTGLTYVNIIDQFSSAPDVETGVTIFNSYAEAYDWADWYQRYRLSDGFPAVVITLWTSGPNQNGYFYIATGSVFFASFD